MRSHPVYIAFGRRWQLPVYFQLRWKEIVGKLEDSLSNTTIHPDITGPSNGLYVQLVISFGLTWSPRTFYIPYATSGACVVFDSFVLERGFLYSRSGTSLLEVDTAGLSG